MKSKLLGHSANDLFWFIIPLILPTLLIRYDLNFTQAGGILTTYLVVLAICSFAIGKLSDLFSRRTILSYGFFLASLGLSASAFAPSLSVFLILISITAVGVSTFHPVMYAVIDDHSTKNKGQQMGLYEGFGTGAILLMFLINGFLLNWIGVRGILILTALPALAMGLVYQFGSSIPEHKHNPQDESEKKSADKGSVFRFSILLLSVIFRVFSVTGVLNFLPTIFVSFLGYERSTASYATAFFFAGGLVGSLTAGKLADRFNSFMILIVGTLFIIPSLMFFSIDLPGWVYLVAVSFFGFFGSACIINQNLLIGSMGSHLGKGEVFGIMMGVMTITASLSPALFGLLIDTAGFRPALAIFLIPLVLSVFLLFLLNSQERTKKELPV
ncbi:MFS transporter [Oceanispirochaeta sp.]|jgi:MFS family permease|uniref:MFS transporter n=1 Tax=Oceanispirochaeta sp. TaxID=2035350 RepID=UPI002623AEC0|nr:MFS transporter [Oceanispirochaeta sp.]MDA3955402.1 MFS transporter [Oceanispirochaeta sp.]